MFSACQTRLLFAKHRVCTEGRGAEVQEAPKEAAAEPEAPQVAVSAKTVKELRAMSSAGMMDCKKALAANNNDLEAAAVRRTAPVSSPHNPCSPELLATAHHIGCALTRDEAEK